MTREPPARTPRGSGSRLSGDGREIVAIIDSDFFELGFGSEQLRLGSHFAAAERRAVKHSVDPCPLADRKADDQAVR